MILVDTSAWIDFFRGKGPLASVVEVLLDENHVAVCGPVRAELRRGIRNRLEREKVLSLLEGCSDLSQPDDLWNEAGDLGALLGAKGATVKTLDLLIATYALAHDATLLTRDSDFRTMHRLGIPLRLAEVAARGDG